MDVEQHGHATARWVGDAFIEITAELEGEHTWHFMIGRSDANDGFVVLYHDPRPTSRMFDMTVNGNEWVMRREDPDFHQTFVFNVSPDRIDSHPDASDDQGQTWRRDFDLIWERSK